MTFNSIEFLVFLPIVLVLYYCMRHRLQNLILLTASYFFYGWWDAKFLFLIVVSTAIDFVCGLAIDRGFVSPKHRMQVSLAVLISAFAFVAIPWNESGTHVLSGVDAVSNAVSQASVTTLAMTIGALAIGNVLYLLGARLPEDKRRRAFLFFSMTANLSILAFFKYFNFFAESLESAIGGLGVNAASLRLDIVLPVGISFYTFQTMSYAIDIYRRQLHPTDRFLDFALFVSYFPQLVAGPIERASELLPRVLKPRKVDITCISDGSLLILWGLFKKIAIADGVAPAVDSIYLSTGVVSWIDIIAATVMFAVQIYCDFSGYTDVARGVSKLMGIDLMLNFRQPYFSTNPSEFWRRWHISLSSWLRDYLYIPLGGNRCSTTRNYMNLMTTMVLGGLWHGAAWNYVLWGFYQGGILSIHSALFKRKTKTGDEAKKGVFLVAKQVVLTVVFFGITCYGWLLFRAVSLDQVVTFSTTLLTGFGDMTLGMKRPTLSALAGIPILLIVDFMQYRNKSITFSLPFYRPIRAAVYATALFLICMGMSNQAAQFIYFQF